MRSLVSVLSGVLVVLSSASVGAQGSAMPPQPAGTVMRKIADDAKVAYNKVERPMVILDLDGAVFDSRPRTAQILREFADQELRTARPDAAQRLLGMSSAAVGYMLTDTLNQLGITEPAVVNNAAVFWSQHFFSDDYVKYDEPVAGSVGWVRSLYSNGARIVYVASRDVPRQLMGTVKALRDRGYPIGIAGTEVILKPTQQTPDAQWRSQLVTYLRQYGKVIATIDTQPANANDWHRVFPEAAAVLLNGPRAPNQPPVAMGVTFVSSYSYE